jgi:anaerobic ribonucleoside-triphosphate reductase
LNNSIVLFYNEDFRRLDHVSTKQTIVDLLLETKENEKFNRNMIEYQNQHLKEQQKITNRILEFQKQQAHAQQDCNRDFIHFTTQVNRSAPYTAVKGLKKVTLR